MENKFICIKYDINKKPKQKINIYHNKITI